MSWTDAQYDFRAAWDGDTLEPLLDYCERVRMLAEVGGGKKGGNVDPSYYHGTRPIPHKFSAGLVMELELTLRYTDSAGAITHVDGAAGHVYENASNIKRIFYGSTGLVRLQRTRPHEGTQSILVENLTPESHGQELWQYVFSLYANKPFWEGAEVSPSGAAIAIGGNAPVDDAIVTIGNGTLTHTETGDTIQNTSGASADIDTSTGQATATVGGADVSDQITFSAPYYLELIGGQTNNFTGLTPTITYKPKWRP